MARLFLIFTISFAILACARKPSGNVGVSLSFPTASQFNAKKKSQGYTGNTIDYGLLCFVVNVTGGTIASSQNSCDITKGLLTGSIAPGGTLSLGIPSGSGMNFEIYGLLRTSASQTCPTGITGSWNWPISQIYFLGSTTGVTIQPPTASVEVDVTLPPQDQNIAAQDSFPATCSGQPGQPATGRVNAAAGLLKGNTLSLYSRVSDVADLKTLKGTQLSIQNWKTSEK